MSNCLTNSNEPLLWLKNFSPKKCHNKKKIVMKCDDDDLKQKIYKSIVYTTEKLFFQWMTLWKINFFFHFFKIDDRWCRHKNIQNEWEKTWKYLLNNNSNVENEMTMEKKKLRTISHFLGRSMRVTLKEISKNIWKKKHI